MKALLLRNRIKNHGPIKDYLQRNGFVLMHEQYNPYSFEPTLTFKDRRGNSIIAKQDEIDQNPFLLEKNGALWLNI